MVGTRWAYGSLFRGSRGFTLTELLVIIFIVGALLALFLPRISSSPAPKRTICFSKLREIGVGMLMFEQSNGHFPGYVNLIDNEHSSDSSQPSKNALAASWAVMLLPYVEEKVLGDQWMRSDATLSQLSPTHTLYAQLEVFTCPSSEAKTDGTDALSYVVNCGSVRDAQHDSIDNPADGVCFNLYSGSVKVSTRYLNENDGASSTILATENLQAQRWASDPRATPQQARLPDCLLGLPDPRKSPPWSEAGQQAFKRWTGFVWMPTGGADNTWTAENPVSLRINGGKPYPTSPTSDFAYSRPSSNHAGGINVLFCDGRVQFIADTIDYKVYTQLMTSRHDAASYDPSPPNQWKYVLDEHDFLLP